MIWRELFSRSYPLIFSAWQDSGSDWTKPPMGWMEGASLESHVAEPFDPRAVEFFFYKASAPMARRFDVSIQAMRIRLEQLGLLLVDYPRQQSLDFVA